MTVKYNEELIQGSDEWIAARCGVLTASEMKLILTPTLKTANNDKSRAHVYEILAQRITGHVEPHYMSDDMLRGHEDEVEARILYAKNYVPIIDVGFITNNEWGFVIGYSPDGLVGNDGLIECKSRRQKFQVQTIIEGEMPDDYVLQVQTGLLVTGRKWCDFVTYSGGLPMETLRIFPDEKMQSAIIQAATAFEKDVADKMRQYQSALLSPVRLIPTERRVEIEIQL